MSASGLTTWGRLAVVLGLAVGLSGCLAEAVDPEVEEDESELLADDQTQVEQPGEVAVSNRHRQVEVFGAFATTETAPDDGEDVTYDPRPDPWDIGKLPANAGKDPSPGDEVGYDPRPDPWDIGKDEGSKSDSHSDY